MPNRSLLTAAIVVSSTAAAIIVSSAAMLIAVFLGLPLLLTLLGAHVDGGLIISVLVAVGAFSAAGAAVWVATSDRRERTKERDAADKAQAGLVRIRLRWQSLGGTHLEGHALPLGAARTDPYAQVIVNNWGTLPIVDVKATRWEWEGHRAEFRNEPTQLDVVMPSPVASGDRVGPTTPPGRRWQHQRSLGTPI